MNGTPGSLDAYDENVLQLCTLEHKSDTVIRVVRYAQFYEVVQFEIPGYNLRTALKSTLNAQDERIMRDDDGLWHWYLWPTSPTTPEMTDALLYVIS